VDNQAQGNWSPEEMERATPKQQQSVPPEAQGKRQVNPDLPLAAHQALSSNWSLNELLYLFCSGS
jgi:hypothetical protein